MHIEQPEASSCRMSCGNLVWCQFYTKNENVTTSFIRSFASFTKYSSILFVFLSYFDGFVAFLLYPATLRFLFRLFPNRTRCICRILQWDNVNWRLASFWRTNLNPFLRLLAKARESERERAMRQTHRTRWIDYDTLSRYIHQPAMHGRTAIRSIGTMWKV